MVARLVHSIALFLDPFASFLRIRRLMPRALDAHAQLMQQFVSLLHVSMALYFHYRAFDYCIT